MNDQRLKVAIIIGSTRPGRNGEAVSRWVYGLAKRRDDADYELVDIKDYNLPLLDEPIPPSMGQYTKEHTKIWATKMTNYAKPNQIIIGEAVYKNLDTQIRKKFRNMDIENVEWNYINNSTGNTYELYINNHLENRYFGQLN